MSDKSVLFKHWQKEYPTLKNPPKFKHSIVKTFKTAKERQVYEALALDTISCNQIVNLKSEYRHNALVRQIIEYRGEMWTT